MRDRHRSLARLSPAKRRLLESRRSRNRARDTAVPGIQRRPDDGSAAASFAQERLWFIDRFESGLIAYNNAYTLRLPGNALDPRLVRRGLEEIVRRHEPLRTRFAEIDGELVLTIDPGPGIELPVADLRGIGSLSARRARAEDLARTLARRPFDLAHDVAVRALLVQLADHENLVALVVHHIAFDRWSLGLLQRELAALYEGLAAGRASPLPVLPIRYSDFAAWQRRWLSEDRPERALAYWRRRLGETAPLPLLLATDRPRPPRKTYRGARVSIVLSGDRVEALEELARSRGATLFMVLLSAFQTLLLRRSRQSDFVVGTPIAGRPRVELESLIGLFLNTLAIRCDLTGNPKFHELLGRIRTTCSDAYAHAEIPFEVLLAELEIERRAELSPLFQVWFNFHNVPAPRGEIDGRPLVVRGVDTGTSKFDLALTIRRNGPQLTVLAEYDSDLFDPVTLRRFLDQYRTLLSAVSREPEERIERYSLVTAAEAALLPDPAAGLSGRFEGALSLHLAAHARSFPERLAVIDPRVAWSYLELEQRTNRLANHLREHGIGRGDVVAIYAHRSAPLVEAVLGIMKAGAAYAILDPAYPAARLEAALEHLAPRGWIAIAAAGEPPSALDARLAHLGPRLRLILPDPALAACSPEDPGVALGPGDLACVTLTSGSTGRPKGVMGRHGPLTHFVPWMEERFDLSQDDRFCLLSALSHDPLQRDVFTSLQLAATLAIPDPEHMGLPERLTSWMWEQRVTVCHLTPALGQLLAGERTEAKMTALRHAFFVGDALREEDVERLCRSAPAVRVVNLYGCTETQRAVSYHLVPDNGCIAGTLRAYPLGKGMADVQLLVLNPAMRLAAVGEIGEIHVRSPHLAAGYMGSAASTSERFLPNPFAAAATEDRLYRTGDLGVYLADGGVEFRGRVDHQVKVRGFRIELGEIETVLRQDPGVSEAVAVLDRDTAATPRLAAYVVGPAGRSPDLPRLRRRLARELPDHLVPRAFMVLASLPRLPNGKPDRAALPAPEWQRGIRARAPVPPRTPMEEQIAEIWVEVLERAGARGPIRVHDDFFELGGHSLLATRVLSRLRRVLSVEVSLRRFFEHPTVAGLAQCIEDTLGSRPPAAPPLVAIPRRGELPLSFAQERLWFLDQLGEGAAYHLPGAVRLAGEPDVGALRAGLLGIVRRHEALRARLPLIDGEPRQVIADTVDVVLPLVDLEGLPCDRRVEEARRQASTEARRPFDLAHGPVLRTTLLRLLRFDHVLLWTFHHIAADGWSLSLFRRELAAHYQAARTGATPPLPVLEIQYADFAAWQRRWLEGEVLETQLAYWRRQLEGELSPMELPCDRPHPARRSLRGGSHSRRISGALQASLASLGRRRGATLAIVLQAAFKTLLHRYTGARDVVVGSPVANRNRTEIEPLIGLFANTLVLRSDLEGDPPFEELLSRERAVALAAYEHQDLPFERLVEAVKPRRDLRRNPLFQVLFAVQNVPQSALRLSGLEVRPFVTGAVIPRLDLEVYVRGEPEGLASHVVYDSDLFDRATAARLADHFSKLLAGVAAAPGQRLSRLPMTSTAERQQLVEWNDTAAAPPETTRAATTVHELVLAQVSRTPEAPAVEDTDHLLSYGELAERAELLATALVRRGVGRESRVGLAVPRSVDMLAGVLGILRAGAAYVPLDPSLPAARLALMAEAAGLSALVSEEGLAAAVPAVMALSQPLPTVWLGSEDTEPAAELPPVDPEQLAYVIFTSGSTGRPKGVQVPHRTVVNFLRSMAREPGMGRGDTLLAVTTLSFDISVLELLLPLAVGGRVVLASRAEAADGRRLAARLSASRASLMQATPAGWRLLLESGWRGDRRLEMLCGGEALPPRLAEELLSAGGELWNLYGPTETTVWSSLQRLSPGAGEVTIGRPIADTRLAVLDRRFEPVPPGVEGELAIGGAGVARGYLGRPGLTAERFVPDPWAGPGGRLYHTGDRVRRAADGRLSYLGRLDHQVKLRGHRIELGEVEAVLEEHPAVARAVALVREESADDHRLTVFWVRRIQAVAVVAELRAHLRAKLPEYAVPGTLVELEALPLSPAGKVDRRRLAARRLPTAEDARVAPRSSTERQLVHLWERLLQREAVGVRDDFFDLGGHSLLAVRLFASVEKAFGVTLPIAALFRAPTVEQLAALLHDPRRRDFRSSVVMICPGGDRPPFFCVPGYPGDPFIFRHLMFHLEADQPVYGFLAPGIDAETSPLTRVEDMAAHYLRGMKSVQPRGPYYLGGLCFGGSVAFEMARRLVAGGEEVALLALFDPYVNTRLLSLYFRWLGLRRRVRLHAGHLRDLRWREALSYVVKKAQGPARRLGNGSAGGTRASREGPEVISEDVVRASSRADRKYRPAPYPGRVTVFRGEGRASSRCFKDPTSGWGRLAGGGVELHHVRGIHQLMFDEPHVEGLAEKLYECLERARIAARHPVGV